jgi:tetratricopeptide (TPR) repeat protein
LHLARDHESHQGLLCRVGLLAILALADASVVYGQDKATARAPTENQANPSEVRARMLSEGKQHFNRANQLASQGKLTEAIEEGVKAHSIAREALGEDSENAIASLGLLARLYEDKDDFRAAIRTRQQVLAIRKRRPSELAWRITDARWELEQSRRMASWSDQQRTRYRQALRSLSIVGTLQQQGKYQLAIEQATRFRLEAADLLGEKNRVYANSLNNLAGLYQSMGDYHRAEPLFQRALEIQKRSVGENHPSYATSLNNLGALYYSIGDHRRAESLLSQALEVTKRTVGENHRDYSTKLNNLAELYRSMGEFGRAVPLLQQGLEITKRSMGENNPHYATILNNLGLCYQSTGDFRRAEPLVQRALEIRKRTLGENHPDYAASLINLAEIYKSMANYRQAEALLVQAAETLKRALGENHRDYSNGLNNLARLYQSLGDYRRAEALLQQALEIRKRTLGENHPDYAESLNNLGALYQSIGDYRRAEPLLQQALEIRRRNLGENHPDYANSLNNLAGLYQSMGDYHRAEPHFQRALEIQKRSVGENHPGYAVCLCNLAGLYQSMGDYRRAEPLFQRALEIQKRSVGENHPSYATSLNNLAAVYSSMGNYHRAEPLYQLALEILKRSLGENHPDYASSLNNVACFYLDSGDDRRAEGLLQQALEIKKRSLGGNHPNYAITLHNLAGLYESKGDYPRARPLLQQALEIGERTHGENHPSYARSLGVLALVYAKMGEYGRAEPLALKALDVTRRLLGENHPDLAKRLNDLALLYERMGDPGRAEPLFQQALEIKKRALGQDHFECAAPLEGLATLCYAKGKLQDAERYQAQVVAMDAQRVRDAFAVLGERQRIDLLSRQRGGLFLYLSVARKAGIAPERAYRALLDWRGAVEDAQAEMRVARDEPALRETYEQLNRARSHIASLAFRTPANAGQQEAWVRRIEALRIEKENVERELALRSARYRKTKDAGRLDPREIAGLIPEGTALVDFFQYLQFAPPREGKGKFGSEVRLVAFVLRKGEAVSQIDLGPAKPVDSAVMNWRNALNGRQSALDAPALELARLIWQPLRPHLAGVKTLLVAPDGTLTWFPLGALPGQEPGTRLIEEMAIGYVSSGRALARLLSEAITSPSPREPSGLLASGAIDYSADPGKASPTPVKAASFISLAKRDLVNVGFKPLPGTGPEVEHIRDAFLKSEPNGQVALLTGSAATEGAVKGLIGQHAWRYVHLATHGFCESPRRLVAMLRGARSGDGSPLPTFRMSDPEEQALGLLPYLRSGLALAGAERVLEDPRNNGEPDDPTEEDGLLTAEEAASMDLRGTEMVVLSACETGYGNVYNGEGVLGLQRAFQAAGAKSVVASLWKVSDPATSVLMEELYRNLLEKKLPKLEALRQAQIFVLRNPQRVREREAELQRGPGAKPAPLPEGGKIQDTPARSSPAWWAAFILSGDWR